MDPENNTFIIHVNKCKSTVLRFLKWFFVLLAVGLAITLLVVIKSLLLTLIISVLLTFLLEPLVRIIENYEVKRIWAIIIVFASLIVIITVSAIFLLPVIKVEIQSITTNLQLKHPSVVTAEFKTTIEKNFPLMKERGLSDMLASYLHGALDDLIKDSFDIIFEFVHIVSIIFTVPVFTFFMLKDGRQMKKAFIKLIPNRYFELTLSLVHKICNHLSSYIRGQLLDAIIVGVLSTVTLNLLNIRYAFLIGALAGCANIIPHFGPIVGAVPAIIVALMTTGSFVQVLVIAVSFAGIQVLDYLFISHMVVFKNIHMHPLLVFIVVLVGGYLMGILGMFIAVLFLGVLKITITELTWGFKHYRIFGRTPHSPSR